MMQGGPVTLSLQHSGWTSLPALNYLLSGCQVFRSEQSVRTLIYKSNFLT